MNKTNAYHWPEKMKYPLWYEERGDRLVLKWSGMSRPAWAYIKDEVKGCEDARWHPDSKEWTVKHPRVSLRNCNALGYLTNGEMPHTNNNWLDVYTEPIDPQYSELLSRIPVEYRAYQEEDLPIILQRKRIELAYEMGLGKTLMGLTVIHIAHQSLSFTPGSDVSQDPNDLFWVVGPLNPLDAWRSELRKWNFQSHPRLITNTIASIRKAMRNAPHPPMVLIIDESANFKNPGSQRSEIMFELSRLMAQFWDGQEYFLNLTGTPEPKDPADWWMQIELLCPGFIREKSPAKLRERLAHVTFEGPEGRKYPKTKGWKEEEVKALGRRLRPICIVRLKKDVEKDLPDKIYMERAAEVDPGTLSAARMIVERETGAARMNLLRQLSDGFQYKYEYREDSEGIASRTRAGTDRIACPKDGMLKDDLDELAINEKSRVIIWGGFQGAVDRITEVCVAQGWNVLQVDGRGKFYIPTGSNPSKKIDNIMDFFQDTQANPERLAFVGNPDAAGEGLTLTKADTMIFYSNTYRADKRQQAEDRFHRIGMDENIAPRIIDYVNLPTDRLVTKNLKLKKDLQKLVMDEIKEVLA